LARQPRQSSLRHHSVTAAAPAFARGQGRRSAWRTTL